MITRRLLMLSGLSGAAVAALDEMVGQAHHKPGHTGGPGNDVDESTSRVEAPAPSAPLAPTNTINCSASARSQEITACVARRRRDCRPIVNPLQRQRCNRANRRLRPVCTRSVDNQANAECSVTPTTPV